MVTVRLTEEQTRFVGRCRVGRLTTVDRNGEAYTVPVCYAFDGTYFYSPIDEKPKRTERPLKRVRNVLETGRATLLIDHYDDSDWNQLAWVMIRGMAELIDSSDSRHGPAVELLRNRYDQYREMRLELSSIILLKPDRIAGWSAGGTMI
jgi:PPOX class probable F420-dependent enzyme